MKSVYAAKLDKDTFNNLIGVAVDITGAETVQVKLDGARGILWVNVNDVCVLRVCQANEIEVEQVDKP